jgi:EmrB/QacA subfamily drug resistance transporter
LKLKLDYKWVALSVTTIGSFMASLDTSIVVIGLPSVLKELNATITDGIWIITGYRLAMTLLLVLFGRLSDMYGRVKMYNIGFAVFTIGSLFCGLSTNGQMLVLSRVLQGAGAALLTANSAAIITDAFPINELGLGIGTNMMANNLGSVAGYSLSGIMISLWGWRSMFLINIPIGILATFWGYRQLKEISVRVAREKFDYAGSILYSTAMMTILYALTVGKATSATNLTILAAGLVLFLVVIFFELRQKHPMLDLRLFKIRMFAAGNVTSFFNSLAYNCGPFLRSLYLQLVMGYSATESGVIMVPLNLVVLFISPISGRLADKFGSRWLSSIGLALNAAAFFWFSTLNRQSTYSTIVMSLILLGLGRALFASPNSSSVMGALPAEKRGVGNGVRMTLNQTGNVLSVPFSMLLMMLWMPYDKLSQIVSESEVATAAELDVFMNAINTACFILGIIMLVAIVPSLLRGPKRTTGEIKEVA